MSEHYKDLSIDDKIALIQKMRMESGKKTERVKAASKFDERPDEEVKSHYFTFLLLRFSVAAVLFGIFFYCYKTQQNIFQLSVTKIYDSILNEDPLNFIDFINQFTYTLKDIF